jgi:hypothetical protein
MNNEPVAWMMENPQNTSAYLTFEKPTREMKISHQAIPLYTHPAKNNGGNPEELNTRQIQDARTSLESTPPFAYAVYVGEDDRQNIFLQFDHPEMCFQKYKKAIPLYTHPTNLTEIIEKNKPEIEKANAYIKSLKDEIESLKTKTLTDEEIWEVINRTAWVGTEEEIRFKIAEAILRKAQEK